MGKQHSDSGDYTYPSAIRFVPSSHHTYGDAAALLDNAVEPTALQSAAAAHQAAQDRRLDALESCTHLLLNLENERMLKLEEVVGVLRNAVSWILESHQPSASAQAFLNALDYPTPTAREVLP